jgi:hypothetical protein
MKDEALQNQIESGAIPDHEDGLAYKHVFNALKKEPEFHVSVPFADRILARLDKKEEQRDYWWLAAGIFLVIIALIITLALTSARWSAGTFTFLSGYRGLILFAIAFILALQWIDRKVLKKQSGL